MTAPTLDGPATATSQAPAIAEFVRAVRGELADLPALTVDELVEGLGADIGALIDDTGQEIGRVVASPAEYAAELRAGADLPPRTADSAKSRRRVGRAVSDHFSVEQARELLHRDTRTRREVVAFSRAIIPAWWVVRGIVVAAVVNLVLATDGIALIVLILTAVVVSVEVGRRQRFLSTDDGRRRLDRGFDIGGGVLLVLMLPLFFDFLSWGFSGNTPFDPVQYDMSMSEYGDDSGLFNDGYPVGNLFVYDTAGDLIRDARILDDRGTFVEVGQSVGYTTPTTSDYFVPQPYGGSTGSSFGVFPLEVTLGNVEFPGPGKPATAPVASLPALDGAVRVDGPAAGGSDAQPVVPDEPTPR